MTYTTLLAALLSWVRKPEAEQDFPTFIALAEAKISRLLADAGCSGAVKRSEATIDAEYVGLPDDLIRPLSLVLSDGRSVEGITPQALERLRAQEEASPNLPLRFAVIGRELRLYPVPDQAYSAELTYQAKLSPLGPTTPSNWLLDAHPDAYLYGALVQAGPYLDDDPRLGSWTELFASAMSEAVAAERAKVGQSSNRLRTEAPIGRRTFNINTGL